MQKKEKIKKLIKGKSQICAADVRNHCDNFVQQMSEITVTNLCSRCPKSLRLCLSLRWYMLVRTQHVELLKLLCLDDPLLTVVILEDEVSSTAVLNISTLKNKNDFNNGSVVEIKP